jgi:ribonuclease P/MRP protein subunit RPP40
LQRDLNELIEWAKEWKMVFNVKKCKIMHLGKRNRVCNYEMVGEELVKVDEERDLGVWVDKSAKPGKQCAETVKKSNRILGIIRRNFNCFDKNVILKLYKHLVRPHLEYCVQAWSPYLKKDIELLEGVQKRALRMIKGYRNKSYEERLKDSGLTTLELRRIRGDMIMVYKMLNSGDDCWKKFFKMNPYSRTRGHNLKLVKQKSKLELRRNFFSCRVVDEWNGLTSEVVSSESLDEFKRNIDNHYLSRARF